MQSRVVPQQTYITVCARVRMPSGSMLAIGEPAMAMVRQQQRLPVSKQTGTATILSCQVASSNTKDAKHLQILPCAGGSPSM